MLGGKKPFMSFLRRKKLQEEERKKRVEAKQHFEATGTGPFPVSLMEEWITDLPRVLNFHPRIPEVIPE